LARLRRENLHGLVNNAGIYQPAALMETDDALWQRHIQINQYGCVG
jgi:3alpha(or 20beta)-hydroxysteroid dehydrogenase